MANFTLRNFARVKLIIKSFSAYMVLQIVFGNSSRLEQPFLERAGAIFHDQSNFRKFLVLAVPQNETCTIWYYITAVFTWVSKVIHIYFDFALLYLVIGP